MHSFCSGTTHFKCLNQKHATSEKNKKISKRTGNLNKAKTNA